jgi:oligopeptide/dipeptide ABC transporter ATP-binding protein
LLLTLRDPATSNNKLKRNISRKRHMTTLLRGITAKEEKRESIILKGEVPSPLDPPTGCSFHPRCFMAIPECSQSEISLYSAIPDYHRIIEHIVIDPPYAAFDWTITGTVFGEPTEMKGCSIVEFNSEGKEQRAWVYYYTSPSLFYRMLL